MNAKKDDPTYLSFEYVSSASGTADLSGALDKTRKIRGNATVCQGVEDLVNDVLGWIRFHKDFNPRILGIRIIGHGNSHGIAIGKDRLSMSTLPDYGPKFQKLNPYFCSMSYIEFYSCKTGKAAILLSDLSKMLKGISVSGYDVNQNVNAMAHGNFVGKFVQCQGRLCVTEASGSGKIDHFKPGN